MVKYFGEKSRLRIQAGEMEAGIITKIDRAGVHDFETGRGNYPSRAVAALRSSRRASKHLSEKPR